jgi:hypothetical protein
MPHDIPPPSRFKYCARYCEENIWHLAQDAAFADRERVVAIISNAEAACLFWGQRLCEAPDYPVWWDYHVILFVRDGGWRVYDLDTAQPFPVDALTYLRGTFRLQERMPQHIRPRFVLFEGDAYVRRFSSDRSHMRDADGSWYAPPPDWPPIIQGRPEGFPAFIERQLREGTHLGLDEMIARFTLDVRGAD